MAHDFKLFPELTNSQLQFYYFESPHKQILEDFTGKVVEVHDGDTVTMKTEFRPFTFPIRMAGLAAPELKEEGGIASRNWLRGQILDKEVMVSIDPTNRVGKYGRLIGDILFGGMSMTEASIREGKGSVFGE